MTNKPNNLLQTIDLNLKTTLQLLYFSFTYELYIAIGQMRRAFGQLRRLRYYAVDANYWRTLSVGRPLCNSRATCYAPHSLQLKAFIPIDRVVALFVGCLVVGHVCELWLNGTSEANSYYWTLIGNPAQKFNGSFFNPLAWNEGPTFATPCYLRNELR